MKNNLKFVMQDLGHKELCDASSAPVPDQHVDKNGLYTVKGARGKVSFDSQNDKYASKLSCYASPEAYLSHLTSNMTNTLFNFLSDKYASGEASLDHCEA
jgi:hypothetical protein